MTSGPRREPVASLFAPPNETPEEREQRNKAVMMGLMRLSLSESRLAGKADGYARCLMEILRQKFGPLPKATLARVELAVEQGEFDALACWASRVIEAETLDAVFAPCGGARRA